ncbi:MAG: serine/threonine-protein kinase [Gemmataceae bacterium]
MDDALTLELLDSYLAELHAGRQPNRARWLSEHPELAPQLDCLDQLNSLAVPVTSAWHDEAPTLAPSVGPSSTESFADGRYELLGELGRGGMGVVYRARQVALNRQVALKMILAGSMASGEQQRRFESEAKAAARVQHPHVVPVFESGRVNGLPYLVMPFIEGESLASRLRKARLAVDEAVRLVAAIARAVAALHAAGIVHRDLKPSNVLLDPRGEPHVTDFGLAKLVEGGSEETQSGAVLGTPQYMAPEQACGGAKAVGPAADVYALGAILYECLTGRPTIVAETPFDALLAVLEGEPPSPRSLNPKLPRSLERVIVQCLDKEPSRRYPSAAALAAALEAYLKGESVPTRRDSLIERLWRWARREPALASRLAALIAFGGLCTFNVWALPADRPMTFQVMGLLAIWAATSVFFQRLLALPQWSMIAACLWSAADVLLLTAVQLAVGAWQSPLLIGYPFLVAASGLWSRVPIVWVTTGFTVVGYIWLVANDPTTTDRQSVTRQVAFLIALTVLGFLTAYQVQRVRALSRYYEGQ